jgi:hypothetical protein
MNNNPQQTNERSGSGFGRHENEAAFYTCYRTPSAFKIDGDLNKMVWRGTHPRGLRWAFTDWDFPGLRTAVQVQGTLNDNREVT